MKSNDYFDILYVEIDFADTYIYNTDIYISTYRQFNIEEFQILELIVILVSSMLQSLKSWQYYLLIKPIIQIICIAQTTFATSFAENDGRSS